MFQLSEITVLITAAGNVFMPGTTKCIKDNGENHTKRDGVGDVWHEEDGLEDLLEELDGVKADRDDERKDDGDWDGDEGQKKRIRKTDKHDRLKSRAVIAVRIMDRSQDVDVVIEGETAEGGVDDVVILSEGDDDGVDDREESEYRQQNECRS